ncbi:hypothetical protein EDB80DRAFT_692234 [Ilyonectria destructans]|nr:hypothetical protein EDB80DRAFT_692234 [Ilyonectria destructans]
MQELPESYPNWPTLIADASSGIPPALIPEICLSPFRQNGRGLWSIEAFERRPTVGMGILTQFGAGDESPIDDCACEFSRPSDEEGINTIHVHPRSAELQFVSSGRLITEMVPENGVLDNDGQHRVIRTELTPNVMTPFY